MLNTFFDASETRSPKDRETGLMAALPRVVHHAKSKAAGFGRILEGVDPQSVNSREALAKLPVTRKSDLITMQAENPPFAGLNATPVPALGRIFQSPGPIYDPEGKGDDWWRMGRFLHAVGIGSGAIGQNCFGYHLTPAGMIFENGARAVGAAVLPAGAGQTELQVTAAHDIGCTAYAGTPDYLKVILDKAGEMGLALKITKAAVGGGALGEAFGQFQRAGAVEPGQGAEQRDESGIERQTVEREQPQRGADRARGQRGEMGGGGRVVGERGPGLVQRGLQRVGGQRGQPQGAAARADRRQEARGLVRDQQERGAGGRFLEHLQQRIGGAGVHLVGGIDDHNPPPAIGCREAEEAPEAADIVDHDLVAQALGVFVDAAGDAGQPRLGPGDHAARDRVLGVDIERFGRGRRAEQAVILLRGGGQQEPRDTPGQCRLADAARAGQQPAVVHPVRGVGLQEGLFRRVLAEQLPRVAGMRRALGLIGGGGVFAHGSGSREVRRGWERGDRWRAGWGVSRASGGPWDAAPRSELLYFIVP